MTPYNGLYIIIETTLHRYIVRRDQILELRLIATQADLERPDERGKPLISAELGKLFDPHDLRSSPRRHAVVVPTRRRSVALLFERIANTITIEEDAIQCIPVLLRKRLQHPWFLGVYSEQHDAPLLVLDLRQIAQDVMLASKEQKPAAATSSTMPVNHMNLS